MCPRAPSQTASDFRGEARLRSNSKSENLRIRGKHPTTIPVFIESDGHYDRDSSRRQPVRGPGLDRGALRLPLRERGLRVQRHVRPAPFHKEQSQSCRVFFDGFRVATLLRTQRPVQSPRPCNTPKKDPGISTITHHPNVRALQQQARQRRSWERTCSWCWLGGVLGRPIKYHPLMSRSLRRTKGRGREHIPGSRVVCVFLHDISHIQLI